MLIGGLGTLISVFSTAQMSTNRVADLKSCLLKELNIVSKGDICLNQNNESEKYFSNEQSKAPSIYI